MKKYLLIALLGLLAALFFSVVYRPGPQVMVRKNPQYNETVYSIRGSDQKELSFTTYQTELNEMVLRWRSNSTLPLKEQLRLAARLLAKINQDRPLASFKTLSIGRLVEAFGSDKTFSRRLTDAARSVSPIPFAKQNNTARDLANQKMIYPELRDLFTGYGISLKVAAMEKVLVNSSGVPYDGLTWFLMGK